MLQRRTLMGAAAGLLAAPRLARAAWPDRPIRLMIPYGGGGQTDVVARLVADAMSRNLGQAVTPDNRPGAAGVVAAEAVVRSPPDGYTLLVGTRNTQAINEALRPNLPFAHARDLVTIGLYATTPNILLVHSSVPARNLAEFIAYAKANPGRLNYASSGIGATTHLSMELLSEKAGIELIHVPYRQSTQGMTDLLAGRVQARLVGLPEAEPVKADPAIRALGVTSPRRSPNWPEVQAIGEVVPGYEALNLFGLMAHAQTPREVVLRLNESLNQALATRELQEAFARVGADPAPPNTPEQAEDRALAQANLWVPMIRRLNLSAQ
ncbi:Bug family tripartite tricarboxylate transporter substrate binding protein [Falsiroseomonas tokyonensis]|uniref:Bug family tripartite tricarboxylate transporter substrate binding protein n=1 Tax=Falsiroseomonas tokyonensis TaxID=430521 RepID=A0ABV7BRG3_9PROT|nr:tripartite tricarboxylate transporter substrate-binding protein [Falsiroseomonas tokyonensis]MBU8536638.1 tripartite tricarboxylate transporter substrate binding protein [Falsiroseomonas tokyonensis]